jgi:hypothetical protein
MKVNIYETVEISDEQRVSLAVVLDEGEVKPKRQATRDEIKAFVWKHGEQWEDVLSGLHASFTAEPSDDAETEADEDLLGDDEDLI